MLKLPEISKDYGEIILVYGLYEPGKREPSYIGCGSVRRANSWERKFDRQDYVKLNHKMREGFRKLRDTGKVFRTKCLAIYDNYEPARLVEKNAIEVYNPPWNLNKGGDGCKGGSRGTKKTPSASALAARIANARLPRTAETLRKQAEGSKKMWADPVRREKLLATRQAVIDTPEYRAKLCEARKGSKNPAFGRVYTPEMRKRWSEAAKKAMARPEVRERHLKGLAKRKKRKAED